MLLRLVGGTTAEPSPLRKFLATRKCWLGHGGLTAAAPMPYPSHGTARADVPQAVAGLGATRGLPFRTKITTMLKLPKIAPLPDWSRRFVDPIFVQNRQQPLRTLRDAAQFITTLPKAEQDTPQWQTAAEMLLLVAERGGDPMFARMAMMKALHHRDPHAAMKPRRKRVKTYKTVR